MITGRQGGHKLMNQINVVPYIDVMLVLLVIFMITAPLMTHSIPLALPKASAQPQDAAPKLDVSIDAWGNRFFGLQPVTRAEAAARFAEAGRADPPPVLQLRIDQDAAYRVVAETIADASRSGLSRVSFVSEPEAGR